MPFYSLQSSRLNWTSPKNENEIYCAMYLPGGLWVCPPTYGPGSISQTVQPKITRPSWHGASLSLVTVSERLSPRNKQGMRQLNCSGQKTNPDPKTSAPDRKSTESEKKGDILRTDDCGSCGNQGDLKVTRSIDEGSTIRSLCADHKSCFKANRIIAFIRWLLTWNLWLLKFIESNVIVIIIAFIRWLLNGSKWSQKLIEYIVIVIIAFNWHVSSLSGTTAPAARCTDSCSSTLTSSL